MASEPIHLTVSNSFFIAYDGRRKRCTVNNLSVQPAMLRFTVEYAAGDEEQYELVSHDGFMYRGKYNRDDEGSLVRFRKFAVGRHHLFCGEWLCGGREGEWVIEAIAAGRGES